MVTSNPMEDSRVDAGKRALEEKGAEDNALLDKPVNTDVLNTSIPDEKDLPALPSFVPDIPNGLRHEFCVFGYHITDRHCEYFFKRNPKVFAGRRRKDAWRDPDFVITLAGFGHLLSGIATAVTIGEGTDEQWCLPLKRSFYDSFDMTQPNCLQLFMRKVMWELGVGEEDVPQWFAIYRPHH